MQKRPKGNGRQRNRPLHVPRQGGRPDDAELTRLYVDGNCALLKNGQLMGVCNPKMMERKRQEALTVLCVPLDYLDPHAEADEDQARIERVLELDDCGMTLPCSAELAAQWLRPRGQIAQSTGFAWSVFGARFITFMEHTPLGAEVMAIGCAVRPSLHSMVDSLYEDEAVNDPLMTFRMRRALAVAYMVREVCTVPLDAQGHRLVCACQRVECGRCNRLCCVEHPAQCALVTLAGACYLIRCGVDWTPLEHYLLCVGQSRWCADFRVRQRPAGSAPTLVVCK